MKKEDYFSLEKIYPDAGKIFSFPYKPLKEVAKNCVFVLDTNILLIPFDVSEKNFELITNILKKLKDKNRLFIPARVAREFAKNRGEKISQIFLRLRQKQQKLNSGHFNPENYPILEQSEAFKKLNILNQKIQEDIKKSRKLFKDVESEILSWNWNDPISLIYRDLFTEDIIIELEENQESIIKELEFRAKNDIAPGFKDNNKVDGGIGDLIIWKTVIQIGNKINKNVVFVSNDKKGDWYYRQDNEGIYPKYELFDEFRANTNGKSINIIDFPKFLEIFNIDEKVIDDVKKTIDVESDISQRSRLSFKDDIEQKLKKGAIVRHPKFGIGEVLEIKGNKGNLIASINFKDDDRPYRMIMLKFARDLEILF